MDEFKYKKLREKGAKLGNKVVRESMILKIRDEKHRELEQENVRLGMKQKQFV